MRDSRLIRLVLAVLVISALALITLDFRGSGTGSARGIGADIFGPVERVAHDITSPVTGVFDSVTGGSSRQAAISRLQRRNAQLQAELSAAKLDRADESQLRKLLQLAGEGGYRIVAANVISAAGDYADTVTIDVGTADGISTNETVLNGSGLVGVVTQAGRHTATVLLADDATAVIGVRLAGSNEIGETTGTGKSMAGGLMKLKLFASGAALRPGQRLVTFGSVNDRPYVPGVPVGTVMAAGHGGGVLTETAVVRPFVNFGALGVVGVVVKGPRHNPRDSVLPHPAPTVTVTVTAHPKPSGSTSSASAKPGASGHPGG